MPTDQQDHAAPAGAVPIWRCLLGQPADLSVPHDGTLADRLAGRSSRALIEALLAPLGVRLAGAANDLLLSRLGHAAQLRAYRRLDEAGLQPVALKGFANAHRLYDDPVLRIVGDLDLLLERRHLKAAIELFAADGFRFAPADKRWGVIGEASFAPFHSADGVCNIDFHVAPDSWPLPLGLAGNDVRSKVQIVAGIRMPSDEHALLIAIANAAKDKFGWRTLGKALDLARLLNRRAAAMDWDEIQRRARAARLEPAMACFFALLRGLGGDAPFLPGPFGGALFRALVAEWHGGFASEPSRSTMLAREALLAHTPATAVTLNLKRLAGLLSPNDGVPAEGRAYV
jgi:hypothetical protein